MAREGQHDAQLRIRGDASSADKELRNLTSRMNQLEASTAKTGTALAKKSEKLKQAQTDMTKWGQQTMEVRGRLLGFAGATVAAVVAIDRMAERSRELAKAQGINAGLAFEWEKMTAGLTREVNDLVLAVNNLPIALRTASETMGILGDETDEASESAEAGASGWDTYAYALGAFGVIAKESIDLLGVLADKVNELTPRLASPRLGAAMDLLKMRAKELQATGLVQIMNRQNAEMERSIEMLEANAKSRDIVQHSLDNRKRSSSRKGAAPAQFGEAFEFTADDIDEMQGGARADREDLAANADQRLEELRDFNQRRIELEFEAEMQRIAMKEELGVLDPMDAVALERDAQLQHIDQLRQTTSDEIELQRLKTQEELVYHNAHIRRSELRRAQQQKELATVRTITQTIGGILQGGAQTAAMASDLFIQGEQRKEKARYAMGATMAFITGVVEQVEAIAAFASFNYVQGALHQAAAIFAFAQGGMLAAKAGGAGSSSTGGAAAMGGGAGMGGGSGGMGGPNVASNRPQGETAIPMSPGSSSIPAANDDPSTKDTPHRTGGRRGTTVVQINARVIDRQTVREIRNELHDLDLAEGGN